MGKLAKPQRSKKHKKLKSVDPFYTGSRKDRLVQGLNQKPKCLAQEVPKKLLRLGFMIDDVKKGNTGKKSKNKFLTSSDAPVKFDRVFSAPMGDELLESQKSKLKKKYARKIKDDPTLKNTENDSASKKKEKKQKTKLKTKDVEEYIDNLKPVKPFVEQVKFKQGKNETQAAFMRRVDREARTAVAKAKLDDQYDLSDEKKIAMMVKAKKSKMNEKKKQRLTERKKKKLEALKEKKRDKVSDFQQFEDKVAFGEVVHAPPVLTTRPKYAKPVEHDRPGLRMPELTEAIKRNMQEAKEISIQPLEPRAVGQTRKRKHMSLGQQRMEDSRRDEFVQAYREMKKKNAKLKE